MKKDDSRCELDSGDRRYPPMLLDLERPPRLHVIGSVDVLSTPCISIIGARDATPYGIAVAEMAARIAVEAGLTVVSGGALGCDSAAGRMALRCGGKHVVVLGTGADVAYPRSSEDVIAGARKSGGAVVSLERWGSPPRRYAFPKRNKVIAALSAATIVTEAGMPSGTFSTAEAASQLGREVIAVPGSIMSPESRGSNYLVSVGATCLVDFDSLEEAISRVYGTLRHGPAACVSSALDDPVESRVMSALIANPMRMDELSATLSMPTMDLMQVVGALNMRDLVAALPDGRFAPTKMALHGRTPLGHNR